MCSVPLTLTTSVGVQGFGRGSAGMFRVTFTGPPAAAAGAPATPAAAASVVAKVRAASKRDGDRCVPRPCIALPLRGPQDEYESVTQSNRRRLRKALRRTF